MSDTIKHYGTVDVSEVIKWTPAIFHICTETGREETRKGHISCTGIFGVHSQRLEDQGRMRNAYVVTHLPTGIRVGAYWEEWKARGFANLQETLADFWKKDNILTDRHAYCSSVANVKLNQIQARGGLGGPAVAALLEDYYTKVLVAREKVHVSDLVTHETPITDERQVAQAVYDALYFAPGGGKGGFIALQDKDTEAKH